MSEAQEFNLEMPEFVAWPKIKRLNREIVITEKIDGTNAAIGITADPRGVLRVYAQSRTRIITPQQDNMGFARWVYENADVLIRTLGEGLHFGEWWGRGIQRNYGLSERRFSLFNAERWSRPEVEPTLELARAAGVAIDVVPMLYRGPWVGVFGYQDATAEGRPWLTREQMHDWPEVTREMDAQEAKLQAFLDKYNKYTEFDGLGEFEAEARTLMASINPRPRYAPNFILEWLKRVGSQAAPGYMNPEGIVVFHKASGSTFKATVEKDEQHKNES